MHMIPEAAEVAKAERASVRECRLSGRSDERGEADDHNDQAKEGDAGAEDQSMRLDPVGVRSRISAPRRGRREQAEPDQLRANASEVERNSGTGEEKKKAEYESHGWPAVCALLGCATVVLA